LATQATRDKRTGQPIVYFSTDAHALRRFIDETWHGAWKMANGLGFGALIKRQTRLFICQLMAIMAIMAMAFEQST
jgi:hypothetical protein